MTAFHSGVVTTPSPNNHATTPLPTHATTSLLHTLLTYLMSAFTLYALTLLLPLAYYIYTDYRSFLSLGPGGTPSTPLGYLRISILRLFVLRNPYAPAPIPVSLTPQTGFLHPADLSKRAGPRPKVRGIAPHRQITQKGSPADFLALSTAIRQLAAKHPGRLTLGTSCFEKHGTGLFTPAFVNRTCNGEVCHAHPSDGSLHLTLHPADAAIVLEKGWGERHPLARGGWCTRFVPVGFLMVYAPRTKEELEGVMGVVRAAVGWVSGVLLEEGGAGNVLGVGEVEGAEEGVGIREAERVRGECETCVGA